MQIKIKFLFIALLLSHRAFSQDETFAREMLNTLCSRMFWGRGYTKDGMQKAAELLRKQMKSYGVKPMDGKNYYQEFRYPVNTFPSKMEVTIGGVKLVPGQDFIVGPDSKGVNTSAILEPADSVTFVGNNHLVMVKLCDKLTWSAEQSVTDFTLIEVNKKALKVRPADITVDIENVFIHNFKTANICGIVKGSIKPDSIIVFTAHYDHLGGMGDKTYFPGANDNASGVVQVMSLAKYYSAHQQPYSIAFILFSGEEAGLVGSKYFTEHPLIPLQNIRLLVNLDLEGTGSGGITVVNATEYPKEFAMLQQINTKYHYLPQINPRGKAANSDHYFFSEKGVPSIFWYTQGGVSAYHDIYDIAATLPMDHYENIFHLSLKFTDALQGKPIN
jgi:Iap family predicted aminopeptidase